jgi:hypothetical protein
MWIGTAGGGCNGRGGAVELVARARAINSFADAVPSAPHTGHATAEGIRLFTGSTSKE